MKVGILETGRLPDSLASHGRYSAMFERLLGPDFETVLFEVHRGELPDRPEACAAYLVTGSSAGVYDDLPWIAPLIAFLRAAKGKARIVGICFGHQVMAEAFGGRAVKSDKGLALGLHTYRVADRPGWMEDVGAFSVAVSHQDQVVAVPPGARIIASSDFTPIAALAYGDQPAISFQCHPEFDMDFSEALYRSRLGRISDAQLEAAVASLAAPNDCARVGGWIRQFLKDDRPPA